MATDEKPIDNRTAIIKNSINIEQNMQTKEDIEDDRKRGWKNPIEFLFACISYAVGLGNVWRFPYLAYRNGGGAFLVPYMIMCILVGIPMMFSELFVGQYSGLGPNRAYQYLAPLFHGLGYCTLTVITYVTIYYMIIISWVAYYFVASFSPKLGWGYCDHDFNTINCYSGLEDQNCFKDGTADDTIFWNKTCTRIASICEEQGFVGINSKYCFNEANSSMVPIRSVITRTLASEEYFFESVLGIEGATWSNYGYPRWQLVCCLAFSWFVAFLCLAKGIKNARNAVFFVVLFPYAILTALLIRSLTLEGAMTGVSFYVTPVWSKLLEPGVWGDAASQIFYSFGLASNSLVTFASYSDFKNNFHTDTIVVSFTNVLTGIFCGFSVFAMLGFMATNLDVSVNDVVQSGPGLGFVAYPEAVLLMPLPHLWAVLFFFMMFTLGMGTQFGGIEALCLAITERFPHLAEHHWRVTAGVSIACFLAGLPMICNGGVYFFTLMEWHTASWAILLLGLSEVVVISWVYGIGQMFDNLKEMNIRLPCVLKAYWWSAMLVLTPAASFAVFVFIMLNMEPTEFNNYVFPFWADAFGWAIGISTLMPLLILVLYNLLYKRIGFFALFKTSPKWKSQISAKEQEADAPNTITTS